MNKTFWMIYVEGGHTPTYKHSTYESAMAEAKRLAELTNKPAYILVTDTMVELDKFRLTSLNPLEEVF